MDEIVEKKLVVADICNTLYDSNTTFDFIRYCVQTGKISTGTKLFRLSISRKSPLFWFWVVMQKLTKNDYHKSIAISLFKNKTEKMVYTWAGEFYDAWLVRKIIPQTMAILEQYKKNEVILVSSTIEPVAKIISERIGVHSYLSTMLEIKDGVYSGRVNKELNGRKLKALENKFGTEKLAFEAVLTDNFTDKELMGFSREKIAVCYNLKQEKFWNSVPGIRILNVAGE